MGNIWDGFDKLVSQGTSIRKNPVTEQDYITFKIPNDRSPRSILHFIIYDIIQTSLNKAKQICDENQMEFSFLLNDEICYYKPKNKYTKEESIELIRNGNINSLNASERELVIKALSS